MTMFIEDRRTRHAAQESETLAAIELAVAKRRQQQAEAPRIAEEAAKVAEELRIATLDNVKTQRQELLDSGMTEQEIDALVDELAAEKAADVRESLERARDVALAAAVIAEE